MQIIFTFLFLLLLNNPFAQAGFIFEPAISYQAGKIDQGPLEGKASLIGPAASLHAGITLTPNFEMGVEGLYGSLAQEYQDNPQVIYDATETQFGAYLAGNFNVCRVWGGFYPIDQLDISSRDQKFKGMAARVGLGIPVIAKINVNFDYTLHNYTQLETSSGKFSIPYNVGTESVPFDVSAFTISLSYILSL